MITAMKYAKPGERTVARKLVRTLLGKGLSISVYDSEEWTVKQSTNEAAILYALATTDEDQLLVRDAEGDKVGWFYLIWGNDPDGSELIADHSDNELCNEIYDEVAGYEY